MTFEEQIDSLLAKAYEEAEEKTPIEKRLDAFEHSIRKLMQLNDLQSEFNDVTIEGMQKLKENDKKTAEGASNTALKLVSAENKIKSLENDVKTLTTTQIKLIRTLQKLEEQNEFLISAFKELYNDMKYYEDDTSGEYGYILETNINLGIEGLDKYREENNGT